MPLKMEGNTQIWGHWKIMLSAQSLKNNGWLTQHSKDNRRKCL